MKGPFQEKTPGTRCLCHSKLQRSSGARALFLRREEAFLKKKQKRRIANAIMVLTIVAIAAAGVWFAGSVRGWWE